MLSPVRFRLLVSGQTRGVRAAAMRGVLRAAETSYSLAVRFRNWRYDRGKAQSFAAGVPVISVGNLTLGGTGKTPMVAWIGRWLRQRGMRITMISRGYGAKEGSRNDEALELEQQLPDVSHLQNPDRVAAAAVAVEELGCQVILLDDGFQHRRLRRDLDIVLLDALEPFGFGHVFPRGMLREPLAGLRRAQVVCLSRADLVGPTERQEVREEFRRWAPQADWVEASHDPSGLQSATGEESPLGAFRDGPIAAFCGIGNPAGFRGTLVRLGYRVVGFREFPDHHAYTRDDLDRLADWAAGLRAEALLCTQKDLVKIGVDRLGCVPLWAVRIALGILRGRDALEARLAAAISSPQRSG